jgi:hypothetical protein
MFSEVGGERHYPPDRKVCEINTLLSEVKDILDLKLPELKPLHSYEFRIGYPISYYGEQLRQLTFRYRPICELVENGEPDELSESITLELIAKVFLPLEIKPPSLNFGILPAEAYLESSIVKNTKNTIINQADQSNFKFALNINIFNNSNSMLSISLLRINPEFSIKGRIWNILGGEKLEIPVEFHPPREQTQYVGEAVFVHKYGQACVSLNGTGASAELVIDEVVDFENLKLDTIGSRFLHLHNKGVLPCHYELDIVQKDKDFWFRDGDPYEYVGYIKAGQYAQKEIVCQCRRKSGSSGNIVVKWKRVPLGKQEKTIVPLKLMVGYPEFNFETAELNFKATYIGINKVLTVRIFNDGNASCNWRAVSEIPTLTLNIHSGILEPGDLKEILVKYTPVEYESLDSSILFLTDAGPVKLTCYGVVGVPFLKVENEFKNVDFNFVTVGQQHTRYVEITNTGNKAIEFESCWVEMKKNAELCSNEEFDFFYVEPTTGTIGPNQTISLKFMVHPKDYNVVYQASCIIRTINGEQHDIHVKAIGGQAIVKMTNPKQSYGRRVSTPVIENLYKRKTPKTDVLGQSDEPARLLMKTHIDNLYEVVAGIRTAEKEIIDTTEKLEDNQLYKKLITSQDQNSKRTELAQEALSSLNDANSALKRLENARLHAIEEYNARVIPTQSNELLGALSKMEAELNDAIEKLGSFGKCEKRQRKVRRERARHAEAKGEGLDKNEIMDPNIEDHPELIESTEKDVLIPKPPSSKLPNFGLYSPSNHLVDCRPAHPSK